MGTPDSERSTGRYENGNAVIDALPALDRERIVPHLDVFMADVPECVVSHGQEFDDVLFPIDAVFSVTAELRLGHVYEVAATGRLGIVGAELALGVKTAPRSVMAQIEGRSARMSREAFTRCVEDSAALTRAVHQHLIRRLFVAEQFIACNFAHDTTQRCARWVLMLRDEIGRDEFLLRHEFLGMMLGLAPAAAAQAAEPLRGMAVLRYDDEVITILDGDGLLDAACECYEAQRRFAPDAA
jgi:CRP-like cAMP-binding protein